MKVAGCVVSKPGVFSLILVASTSAAALLGAQARILAPGLCLITWNRGDCKNDDM